LGAYYDTGVWERVDTKDIEGSAKEFRAFQWSIWSGVQVTRGTARIRAREDMGPTLRYLSKLHYLEIGYLETQV
jgi:hypothetical protein